MKAHVAETNIDLGSTDSSLRAVIAYDDLATGRRAMRMMADIGQGLGENIDFEPLPWSFDLLADMDWHDVAASDAVSADILIIARTGTSPQPAAVGRWDQPALGRACGSVGAVVARFGPLENPDSTDSSRLKTIQRAAQQAGLAFFAPAPSREPDQAIPGIDRQQAIITPYPAARWGINE